MLARGVGQVYFANSPLAGLLIMLALCAPQPWLYALLGIIGVSASTATALALRLPSGLVRNGLFGFNGLLVGQAAATFIVPHGAAGYLALALALVPLTAALSTILTQALGSLLVPVYQVPGFTLPFNLATLALLMAVGNSPSQRLQLVDFLSPAFRLDTAAAGSSLSAGAAQDYGDAMTATDWVFTALRGVSQVYLSGNEVTGAAMLVALAFWSPIGAAWALAGSIIGSATAMLLNVPTAAVVAGLWGYNASLTAVAVGGLFYVLDRRIFCLTIVAAACTSLIQAGLVGAFAPLGMPVMTLPFCLATLATVLMRTGVPVSLATLTTAEDSLRRRDAILARRKLGMRRALWRFGKLHTSFLDVVSQLTHEPLASVTRLTMPLFIAERMAVERAEAVANTGLFGRRSSGTAAGLPQSARQPREAPSTEATAETGTAAAAAAAAAAVPGVVAPGSPDVPKDAVLSFNTIEDLEPSSPPSASLPAPRTEAAAHSAGQGLQSSSRLASGPQSPLLAAGAGAGAGTQARSAVAGSGSPSSPFMSINPQELRAQRFAGGAVSGHKSLRDVLAASAAGGTVTFQQLATGQHLPAELAENDGIGGALLVDALVAHAETLASLLTSARAQSMLGVEQRALAGYGEWDPSTATERRASYFQV